MAKQRKAVSLFSSISPQRVEWAFIGEILVAFSLGAMYSIQLVRYGYFILIAATILVSSFLNEYFLSLRKPKRMSRITQLMGFVGGILLLLFLGIQSPQMPFKLYLFIGGLLLILQAARDLVKR